MSHVVRLCPRAGFFAALLFIATAAFAADPAPLLDEAECAALGEKLAGHFNNRETAQVVQLLDTFALLDRITPGLGYTEAEERDFRVGAMGSISRSLAKQFENFTSARFLRVQTVGRERRALVRLLSDDGAANYMAFVCSRRGSNALRWADAFIYMSGETISESTRRTVLPLVADAKKGLLDRLTRTESEFVRNFKHVQEASKFLQAGEFPKAWAACEKLPAAVKNDRTVLLLRLRSAQAIDDGKYLEVIQNWEAAFPNDATLDFISIDGDILRKNFAKAVVHIDSFAKRIGGDAYLDFLAANVFLMAEKFDESRTRARAALRVEPTLASAYDVLIAVSLKAKKPTETVAVLDELRKTFPGIDLDAIVSEENYAEFRGTPEFRAWSARQKSSVLKKN